ncbi:unnamed protein product [Prorocentrum cordatum]|uniref:Uncharacterized protein n=1 Tax=Prorocentrum cordatum TaxID=2364126 RepID=A0ABN9T832_9DINO|nr:unnamed protein product [Polarella glacialis]
MPLEEPKWALKRSADSQGGADRKKLLTQIGSEAGGGGSKQAVLERMMKVLAALALTQAAELRDLIAAVYFTFLIPSDASIAVAMKKAGQDYHAQAKLLKSGGGGGHDILGPPFLHVFKALLQAAHEVAGLTGQHREMIAEFWANRVLKEELFALAEQIRHCRIRDTRKKENAKDMMRITICFSSQWKDLEVAVVSAIKKENGVLKIGPPPRGPLEREASKLLDELNNMS